ncbi:MAG: hypothetical protein K0S27_60 [Gammaproteobacteria bacterium]|jgi:hypothetical protein|nr:hypothetical protein [Gammaproteobacteria bacterium]
MPYLTPEEIQAGIQEIKRVRVLFPLAQRGGDKQLTMLHKVLDAFENMFKTKKNITAQLTRFETGQESPPVHGILRTSNRLSYHVHAYYTPLLPEGAARQASAQPPEFDRKTLFDDFLRAFYSSLQVLCKYEHRGALDRDNNTGPLTTSDELNLALQTYQSLIRDSGIGCLDERVGAAIRFTEEIATSGKIAPELNYEDFLPSEEKDNNENANREEEINNAIIILKNTIDAIKKPFRFPPNYHGQIHGGNKQNGVIRPFDYTDVAHLLTNVFKISEDIQQKAMAKLFARHRQENSKLYKQDSFLDILFDDEDAAKLALHCLKTRYHDHPLFAQLHLAYVRTNEKGHPVFSVTKEQYEQIKQEIQGGPFSPAPETRKVSSPLPPKKPSNAGEKEGLEGPSSELKRLFQNIKWPERDSIQQKLQELLDVLEQKESPVPTATKMHIETQLRNLFKRYQNNPYRQPGPTALRELKNEILKLPMPNVLKIAIIAFFAALLFAVAAPLTILATTGTIAISPPLIAGGVTCSTACLVSGGLTFFASHQYATHQAEHREQIDSNAQLNSAINNLTLP